MRSLSETGYASLMVGFIFGECRLFDDFGPETPNVIDMYRKGEEYLRGQRVRGWDGDDDRMEGDST
jgi:hypothetical protein